MYKKHDPRAIRVCICNGAVRMVVMVLTRGPRGFFVVEFEFGL